MWVISNNLVLLEIFQIKLVYLKYLSVYLNTKIANLLYILHFTSGSDGKESACNVLYINRNNMVFYKK